MKRKIRMIALFGLIMLSLLLVSGMMLALGNAPSPATVLIPAVICAAMIAAPFTFCHLTEIGAVKIRVKNPDTITYKHSSATVKDTVYLINGIPMLAVNSADANVTNVFLILGVIEYAKLSAQAWTGGQKVYWDDGNSRFTTAASGNTLAGIAAEAAANPSSTGFVFLNPFMVGTNQMEHTITDPGNGGAIPVTASGVCAMTSAGAETRTLAAPTYLGQTIALIDDTHVGNIVVTCASLVNQTGNNTLTFGAAADACFLVAMSVGGDLKWRIMGNDGVALSTV